MELARVREGLLPGNPMLLPGMSAGAASNQLSRGWRRQTSSGCLGTELRPHSGAGHELRMKVTLRNVLGPDEQRRSEIFMSVEPEPPSWATAGQRSSAEREPRDVEELARIERRAAASAGVQSLGELAHHGDDGFGLAATAPSDLLRVVGAHDRIALQ